jgi:hypothetical protein
MGSVAIKIGKSWSVNHNLHKKAFSKKYDRLIDSNTLIK